MKLMTMDRNFRCLVIGVITLMTCSVASSDVDFSQCDEGWVSSSSGLCYRFSGERLSWSDARKECGKFDSILLRIYTAQDIADVRNQADKLSVTRWWTDLNDFKTTGIWVWGQGAQTTQVMINLIEWNTEPDDTSGLENCGALNFQGAISDERCADKYSYICEYSKATGNECQNGWINYKNGCYKLVTPEDPWNLVTWSDAKKKCNTIFTGTQSAYIKPHLLYIETMDELTYIRKQLPLVQLTSQLWWIGMTDVEHEGHFKWTDGTAVQINNMTWAAEPNNLGGLETCGILYKNGKFGDLNCNRTENYICMKDKDEANPSSLTDLGCPARWIRAGHSCYLLETRKQLSWQDAKLTCSQAGAQLLKVDSLDEKSWLEQQSLGFDYGSWYWTGLNNRRENITWRWADGSLVNKSFIKWNSEPNNYMGSEDCATVSQTGLFNDEPCLAQQRFICEMQTEDAPCPKGWLTLVDGDQENCYFISNTTGTVDEARSSCHQLSSPVESYMWAPNTQAELNFVVKQLQSLPPTRYHWFTGLTDSGHEGYWGFDSTFNMPPQDGFIPWSRFPNYIDGDERCAYMEYSGEYVNRKCNILGGYICEKLSYGFADTSSSSSSRILISCSMFLTVFISQGIRLK